MKGLLSIIIISLILVASQSLSAQNNGIIQGKVCDDHTGNPLPGTTVVIKGGGFFSATVTDLDGNYKLNNIIPGKYKLIVGHTGYKSRKVKKLPLDSGVSWVFNLRLSKLSVEADKTKMLNKEIITESNYSPPRMMLGAGRGAK